MAAPNMATITASLERSLQKCSLNHNHSHQQQQTSTSRSSVVDSPGNLPSNSSSDGSLELNSQISLPYHWEQCLDLKTGEIYYINWRTGMKVTEDPRTTVDYSGDFYSDDDDTSYDSDGSSSEEEEESRSCLSSARNLQEDDDDEPEKLKKQKQKQQKEAEVLVVAGCKSCLMYFMVAKQVVDCPKCCGQLLHFDRSENGSAHGSP